MRPLTLTVFPHGTLGISRESKAQRNAAERATLAVRPDPPPAPGHDQRRAVRVGVIGGQRMHDSGDVRKALDALHARHFVTALYLVRRHGDAPDQTQLWAKERTATVTVMTDPDDLARLQLDGVVSFGDANALRDRLRAAGLAVWEPLRRARRRIT